MGAGIGLFLGWENGIGVTGTGIWPLGMGNEVLKNGNGIEIVPVDFQFFAPFKFVPNRKFHLIWIFKILTAGMSSTKIIIKNI